MNCSTWCQKASWVNILVAVPQYYRNTDILYVAQSCNLRGIPLPIRDPTAATGQAKLRSEKEEKKKNVKRKNVADRQRCFQHVSQGHGGDPAGHTLLTEDGRQRAKRPAEPKRYLQTENMNCHVAYPANEAQRIQTAHLRLCKERWWVEITPVLPIPLGARLHDCLVAQKRVKRKP